MKVFLILLCFVTLAVSAVSGYLGCEPGQKLVVRHFPSPTKYMYGCMDQDQPGGCEPGQKLVIRHSPPPTSFVCREVEDHFFQ